VVHGNPHYCRTMPLPRTSNRDNGIVTRSRRLGFPM
jgi:hypothetical protein